MANLFWKTKSKTKALLATPFTTEEEFEKTVFDTSEVLEDIFLLKRQIRGGRKSGVPDIVGVDSDGNVCIIEMKNDSVSASIIPQVLEYAFWAESNPDSVKTLWLESDNQPEDLSISWEDCQVRILILAPTIFRSTLDLVDKINYQVDLIEVKRWVEGSNELLLVNKLEQENAKAKTKPVSGLRTYDADFYKRQYNSASATQFMRYAREVERLVKKKGWQLDLKFNKHYCGFKAGFFNAFGIRWVSSKTFAFFLKIDQSEAKRFKPSMTRYAVSWKDAYYHIDPKRTKVADFAPLFELAYRKVTGD